MKRPSTGRADGPVEPPHVSLSVTADAVAPAVEDAVTPSSSMTDDVASPPTPCPAHAVVSSASADGPASGASVVLTADVSSDDVRSVAPTTADAPSSTAVAAETTALPLVILQLASAPLSGLAAHVSTHGIVAVDSVVSPHVSFSVSSIADVLFVSEVVSTLSASSSKPDAVSL